MEIRYVDDIEKLNYDYLPTYKKSQNGKYLQLCITKLSDKLLNEIDNNTDITHIVSTIEQFSESSFKILGKKMNIEFIKDTDENKQNIIKLFLNKK